MKKLITVVLGMLLSAAVMAAPVTPGFFEQQGIKVLSSQKGPGGLNVWKVEKGGIKTVFYSTADDKVLLSGVLWDAKTGANLSDAYLTPDIVGASSSAQAQAPVAVVPGQSATPTPAGQLPEAIKGIDRLAGVKEGKGGPERTLYIIFDPKCPHCHAVYAKTRQFIAQGGTIKWIPATVLGRQASVPIVAAILQDPNPVKALGVAMTLKDKANLNTQPTPPTLQALKENETYFWAAFDRNPGAGQVGVPVGFFLTREGVAQMVGELNNDALLQRIFADMKK